MQLLHLRPKQNERFKVRRVAEGPALKVLPRLLPHCLAVARQRRARVAREKELIVPVQLAVFAFFEEVVAVELLVHRLARAVLIRHRPRLVRVRQPELEHRFEELGVGGVFHHALALETSRRLRSGKLFCLAARCGRVLPALKAVRDADDLPRLFVHLRQIRELVLQIARKIVDVDEAFVARLSDVPALAVLGIGAQVRPVGERDARACLHQSVDDLLLNAVARVLLVADHVNVAVSEQLAEDAHAALQDDRVAVRPVIRDAHRRLNRQAVFVHRLLHPADKRAVAALYRRVELFEVLRLALPVLAAAPRARTA